jgi:hypothetical protein
MSTSPPRPFNPWAWLGATALGLGLGMLVWAGVMGVLAIPLRLMVGGVHPSAAQQARALALASLPAGALGGWVMAFLQERLLRAHLPTPTKLWLWASALGHGLGLTALVTVSEALDGAVGRTLGAALWGLCVGLPQAWVLLRSRAQRAWRWLPVCILSFAADGPVSAVGRQLRVHAVATKQLELIPLLSWGPWLVTLAVISLATALAMRWVLAGPSVQPEPDVGGGLSGA